MQVPLLLVAYFVDSIEAQFFVSLVRCLRLTVQCLDRTPEKLLKHRKRVVNLYSY